MSRLIFFLLVAMLAYYLLRTRLGLGRRPEKPKDSIPPGPSAPPGSPTRSFESADVVADPVCGTFVDPANALSVTSDGRRLFFCSENCRDKYLFDHR